MHRAASRRQQFAGWLADRAGRLTRSTMRTVPGAGGAVLLAVGLGEVYRPLLLIAGGLLLLVIDRRVQ